MARLGSGEQATGVGCDTKIRQPGVILLDLMMPWMGFGDFIRNSGSILNGDHCL